MAAGRTTLMPGSLPVVLSLDLGTSQCKGALYSADGDNLGSAAAGYELKHPASTFSEQQPLDYLQSARQVCRDLAQEAKNTNAVIAAVGLSTQTPTLVFCDEAGKAVYPAIIWQDSRSGEEAEWLLAETSPEQREEWFGLDLPIGATSTPAKLLWMKRNAPEIWQKTRWVAQPKDYLARDLTGHSTTDHWCAKGIAHLRSGQAHPDYLKLLGKSVSLSPPMLSPLEFNGVISEEASREWSLSAGTPVSVGWSDALAGILATGALHRERLGFVLTGTSEIVGISTKPREQSEGIFRVPGDLIDVQGLELHYGPTQSGGCCLEWLAQLLGRTPEAVLSILDDSANSHVNSILFRPYLYGERAPYWNHRLTASFEGLRGEHTAADFVHAVLQGIALHERLVLECAKQDQEVDQVVVAGGAARNRQWDQLRADVLQCKVHVLDDPATSLRGAALLAWSALGTISIKNPPTSWFSGFDLFPNHGNSRSYQELMERFRLPKPA